METQVKMKDGRKAIAKLPPLHEAQLKAMLVGKFYVLVGDLENQD